jgi:hypothetical protein
MIVACAVVCVRQTLHDSGGAGRRAEGWGTVIGLGLGCD